MLLIFGTEGRLVVHDLILLRGLAREQGHWGVFTDKLLKVPGVNSIHCIDLPGNGQYFKLTSPLSIEEMAEFVHSHNPLQGDKPATLVAISMGAMVAIELANQYPESYRAAYLMNTSLSGVSPIYQRLRPKSLESFYRILRSGTAREKEQHILELVCNSAALRGETLEEWTRVAHARPTLVSNALRQLVAAGRYRLPKVRPRVPMALMTSKADRMVDFKCTIELAKTWGLPVAVNENCGHEMALDDPDWVCETLKGWLKDKESFAPAP